MKEKFKKTLIVVLPVVFALAAAISVAMMIGSYKKANPNEDETKGSETESIGISTDVSVGLEGENGEIFSEGLEFESLANGGCMVSGYGSCQDSKVIIPKSSPKGEVVLEIGKNAFSGLSVTEIVIPDTVMVINGNAFSGSDLTCVSIGASVISIDSSAFANCKSLSSIDVKNSNAIYTSNSGVLYERDMDTLICYPCAKKDSSYTIPKSVKTISKGAFADGTALKSIAFGGTKKQWGSVVIADGNNFLKSVKMSFAPDEK